MEKQKEEYKNLEVFRQRKFRQRVYKSNVLAREMMGMKSDTAAIGKRVEQMEVCIATELTSQSGYLKQIIRDPSTISIFRQINKQTWLLM